MGVAKKSTGPLFALLLTACSSTTVKPDTSTDVGIDSITDADADRGDGDTSADAGPLIPLRSEIEPGVWRELVTIPAPAPPPNPISGEATPEDLNKAMFLRYSGSDEPSAVRAIVVCMPGMPAGAMAYDHVARRLIKLSQGSIELWAIDRRANLLEDLTGMQAAERDGDPELAWKYYYEGLPIRGKRFSGNPVDVGFMSEWGLSTAIADLRAVLGLIPAAARQAHVVLVGHSFGAAFVQAYAAWELEGGRGAATELAALALLDGGLPLYPPIDEQTYLKVGAGSVKGLAALREASAPRYLDFYGLGDEVFRIVEITTLTAALTPEAVVDREPIRRLATLLFMRKPPPMTAAAAVGFAIDDASSPSAGSRARCGAPDGPVEAFSSPLTGEQRWRPTRSGPDSPLYGWRNHDEVSPPEKTSISVLARVSYEGPTNRVSWYMPARLRLDISAISALDVTGPQDWRYRDHDLRATRNAAMDAPVLVVLAGQGLVRSEAAFSAYRASIAPTVGSGRPQAGADRQPGAPQDGTGFAVISLSDYAHDDIVHGSTAEADDRIYRPLLQWILSNVSDETISIPAQPGS